MAADHAASSFSRGYLALVDWNKRHHEANTHSGEQAVNQEHRDVNRAPLNSS